MRRSLYRNIHFACCGYKEDTVGSPQSLYNTKSIIILSILLLCHVYIALTDELPVSQVKEYCTLPLPKETEQRYSLCS